MAILPATSVARASELISTLDPFPHSNTRARKHDFSQFLMKPTATALNERIEFTGELLCDGLTFGEIKTALRSRYGPISARTAATYLTRARERLLVSSTSKRSNRLAIAVAMYEAIIRDPKSTPGVRISAQTRIDKLFGLDASPRRRSFP